MKVYTKKGDLGETSLVGGKRVSKSELRINTYGTVDELNSWVGMLYEINPDEAQKNLLKEIQDRLFTIGSELASDPEQHRVKVPDLLESDIELLERSIDVMAENLDPLRHFILPGGHVYVSYCHVARTVCRRAERLAVALHQEHEVPPLIIKYLNRLSDFLFMLARKTAKEQGIEEIKWLPRQ